MFRSFARSISWAVLIFASSSLLTIAAGAVIYGALQNAPDSLTFVAYRDIANPIQVLTQANLGSGYAKPNWQLDTTNFAPEQEAGAAMRIVFSDPASSSRLWEKAFANPNETTDLGEIAEGSALAGNECPAPDLTVEGAGDDQLRISWTAQSGVVYNLYHTSTGANPAGNGRYDLLQAAVASPYLHTNPNESQNWYLLVPVDDNSKPLGCISVSSGYRANAITLRQLTGTTGGPLKWLVLLAALLATGTGLRRK